MAELKTKPTNEDVFNFINEFANTDQKKQDAFELVRLFSEWTGFEPKMWGPSIIGFGEYFYKSEKSSQQGVWPLVGFSPRKAAISLYVYTQSAQQENFLNDLGKFTKGAGCIYAKKLSDINLETLKALSLDSIRFLQDKYGVR
jgi:hypothetical protein